MTVRALLRLCRIPNVFTAAANVVAGVVLARGGRFTARDLLLVGASCALYLAGMVLNDYFDREVDARERPERPIPAGDVSAGFARALGLGLAAAGILLAALHSGAALAVAGGLALAILLYDGGLKGTALGPAAMGACRFLNVCLGLSVAAHRAPWTWLQPEVMGAYTVALTYLARDEVGGLAGRRARIGVGMLLGVLGAAGLALVLVGPLGRGAPMTLAAVALVYGYLWWRARGLFWPLLGEASPARVGRAIGGGILLMPALDALMLAAGGHLVAAAAVFALAAPAYALKRHFYLT
jgi:4-hydroxybenzoate polyprenyltransferase